MGKTFQVVKEGRTIKKVFKVKQQQQPTSLHLFVECEEGQV